MLQDVLLFSSYAQNAFRTQEIAQLAKKYNRKICFYGRDNMIIPIL